MENNLISIGNRLIGDDHPTYIIAEIGINHNGKKSIAKQLIDIASESKVDAIKFQKRHLPSLYLDEVLTDTLKYEQNFQYMIPILKEIELSYEDMTELREYTISKGLEFICTPFDIPSADFLDNIGVNAYKIASADLTNLQLIEHVANKQKPILISTGMSYWNEIEKTVELLRQKNASFALMHCRSVYPVWPREVNLRMLSKLKQFKCPVGYSGHDIGIVIPLVAASMGACIIEKHITLSKNMQGPDHKISLEAFELKRLVRDIRIADQAMGKTKRFLLRGEILNRELFGKSLISTCPIQKNTVITKDMIQVKGPGKGLSPSRIGELIGKTANRDIKTNDFFLDEDIDSTNGLSRSFNFKNDWGLIARFTDYLKMLPYNPRLIEFHLAEHDFDIPIEINSIHTQKLVVHAPEYMGDQLLDLCSNNPSIIERSLALINKTIKLTKKIAPFFSGVPKVIVHPGAMSLFEKLNATQLHNNLLKAIPGIDSNGVEVLFENLPPYPWYFGGQWKGNYFMDAPEIKAFCEQTGTRICFDLSHAALYCNAKGLDLKTYIETLKPFISHIHFADAYGLDGEGVQIGEGDISFDEIMPLFSDYTNSWVPEIWRGHLYDGKGFLKALEKLAKYSL